MDVTEIETLEQTVKKKKINVQAGKSVREDSDYIESDTTETTSRLIEDVDEDNCDIESAIAPSVIQRMKKPLANKGKVIKEQASTSGIKKRKTLLENKNKINKVSSEEKKKTKEKLAMDVKEHNIPPKNISLDQDNIFQLDLDLLDNLDVNSMPILFEDIIPFSDDVTSTDNTYEKKPILNNEQKENNEKPSVKGKGVGKKSTKKEKLSENTDKKVNKIDETDKILVTNCDAALHKKIAVRVSSAEVEENFRTYKNQKKMYNKERKKTVEAIPGKIHKLRNQNLQLEKKFMVQEEISYSLDDSEIYSIPLISEENISVCENVTIQNSNEYKEMITDSDNQLDKLLIDEKESSNKESSHKNEKLQQEKQEKIEMYTDNEEITIKENLGKPIDEKVGKRTVDSKNDHAAEPEKKKIKIISNKLINYTTNQMEYNKYKNVPNYAVIKIPNKTNPKSDSGQINKSMPDSKFQRYYRNDAEILKDLADD